MKEEFFLNRTTIILQLRSFNEESHCSQFDEGYLPELKMKQGSIYRGR
jgi:hypothetical protein